MTRLEQVFEAVTDEGVSAEQMATLLGTGWTRAREHLAQLHKDGRIHRACLGSTRVRYFRTAEAAQQCVDNNIRERALGAIDDRGVTSEAIAKRLGMTAKSAQAAIHALSKRGRVHAAKLGHKTAYYFLTKEAAEAFLKARKSALPPSIAVKVGASFSKGAQIIIPDHVKPQECPPFKGLGFAEPERVIGGFSTLGIGKYLPDEDAALRRLARKA